jgi:hypothetical protein
MKKKHILEINQGLIKVIDIIGEVVHFHNNLAYLNKNSIADKSKAIRKSLKELGLKELAKGFDALNDASSTGIQKEYLEYVHDTLLKLVRTGLNSTIKA